MLYRALCDRVFGVPGEWSFRRCQACGSLWLDPRPVAEDRILAYASYLTHDVDDAAAAPSSRGAMFARWLRQWRDVGTDAYVSCRFGYPLTRRSYRARAVALIIAAWAGRRLDAELSVMRLRWRPGGRVLDIGAGGGAFLERMRDLGWAVHGLDFDPDAVTAAAMRGVEVQLGDPRSLNHRAGSFDAVVLSHVIEHLEDPGAVLAEAWRVLAPGGSVVIVTPNADSLLHRRYGADWQPLEAPRHLQVFTPASLARMAERMGLENISTTTIARGANGVARAASKFRRDGRWDPRSRPTLVERLVMEAMQQWEGLVITVRPDAGEELVLTAVKP